MSLKNSFLIFFLIISPYLFSYPEVDQDKNNIFYKQLQSDILENGKRLITGKEIIPLQFFKYNINQDDSIFTVSSRFNIPYESIATLNNIQNQLFFKDRNFIYIPNCPGLFFKDRKYDKPIEVELNNESFNFYPGGTFTGKERLDFLSTPFKSPLKFMKITSDFGYRANPFTGSKEFHSGVDLKASEGTTLFAPSDGVINNIGFSDFYGNYLIITHEGGYSTHYYHLKSISVKLNQKVFRGTPVAETGNSGKSTGPHLHMEIHYNSEPVNPRPLLGEI